MVALGELVLRDAFAKALLQLSCRLSARICSYLSFTHISPSSRGRFAQSLAPHFSYKQHTVSCRLRHTLAPSILYSRLSVHTLWY